MSDTRDDPDGGPRDFVISWRDAFELERPGEAKPESPFAEAFGSRLAAARDRLNETEAGSCLAKSACDVLMRSLERLLCDLCAWPLQRLRASKGSSGSGSSDGGYRAFVEGMRDDELRGLFDAYPLVEERVEIAERTFLDTTRELSRRLSEDRGLLERSFGGAEPLGDVVEVRAGLSDRHDGGRCVAALTFESGVRVYYKPRDVGLELEYNRLLETLDAEGAPLPLRRLTVLDRDGEYGWVEAVEARSCEDREQVRAYFRRAGMLVALWWLLDGVDLHRSNIVASGEDPVLVDAETFFQGSGESSSLGSLGVLPRLEDDGGARIDISGLGGAARQRTGWRIPEWRRLERALPRLRYRPAFLRKDRNAVLLRGKIQSVTGHSEELLAGFEEMYRFLAGRSQALTANSGPLRLLASRTRRVVVRRTRDYFAALNVSLQPRNLRAGVDPDRRLFERLGEPPMALPGQTSRQVLEREVRALRRLDIPRFVFRPEGPGEDPAEGRCRRRLQNMGTSTLDACLSEIRIAVATRILDRNGVTGD